MTTEIYLGTAKERAEAEAARAQAIDIIARTLWGEARNQGEKGMRAVANVIGNRTRNPGWGRDYISVCNKRRQFSCWNRDDPNLHKLKAVTKLDAQFRQALEIASQLVESTLPDITQGSDHYLVTSIADKTAWAKGKKPQAIIGDHSFYRLGLAAKEVR